MVQDNLFDSLLEINRDTAGDLFRMHTAGNEPNSVVESSGLIFPKYRKDNSSNKAKIRISEQEARLCYCFNLNNNKYKYPYSIETPTSELYCFNKESTDNNDEPIEKGRSALSDLSIYDNSLENKLVNVEFKAHNPKQESYNKDIEKLIKEGVRGNWFHLLKNTNNGTIKSLNRKFKSALNKVISENDFNKDEDLWILFFIVILEGNVIKHKKLRFSQLSDKGYIEKLFSENDDWETQNITKFI